MSDANDFVLIGEEEHRKIVLAPYNPSWPGLFNDQSKKIQGALGDKAIRIDHIGSTSVEGLIAKPIIDIQVSILEPNDESSYVPFLEEVGYELRVRQEGRRMLRTPERDVHVHVCRTLSDWERRHILFRDRLRSNEQDRKAYANAKKELAKKDWETMNHYADAKSDIVKEITARAEDWAASTHWQP